MIRLRSSKGLQLLELLERLEKLDRERRIKRLDSQKRAWDA